MGYHNVFEVAVTIIAVSLMLVPFPVQLAPARNQEEIQRRQTDNITPLANEAVGAFNGLAITFRYIYNHPNFSSEYGESDSNVRNISDTMCDLLAYHDLLVETEHPGMTNDSTGSNNVSQDLLTLLKANIQDSCIWLKLMQGANDTGSTNGEGKFMCEMDQLRLYCVTRRLISVTLVANRAIGASIRETYDVVTIPWQCRDWIDNNVPHMEPSALC